jgi:hypothetical protein
LQRFWHQPVRAERLAFTRILIAGFLFVELFVQYLPWFDLFYGPEGVAPAGVHDEWLLSTWRWTILFFNTDDLRILYPLFGLRIVITFLFLVGWQTRIMSVLVWFTTICWINRNPALRSFADDVLMAGLFLLMLAPCGAALSVDSWLRRRKLPPDQADLPAYTIAWPLRLIQIQMCILYLTTGLSKLIRVMMRGEWNEAWWQGTWWDGTSLHYVFSDTTMSRWSHAQLPIPFWATVLMTYASVWWEVLFPLLMLSRWSRKWTLWFGVALHFGIFMTMEVGWFGFYMISLYAVWIPDEFWARWRHTSPQR